MPTVRPRNWLYGKLYFEPAASKKCTPLLQYRANDGHQEILVLSDTPSAHLVNGNGGSIRIFWVWPGNGMALSTIGSCQQSMFTKAWINSKGFTIPFVPATLAPSRSDILAVEFLASRSMGRETKWHPKNLPSFDGFETPCSPGQYYLLKPCCHNKIAGRSTVQYLTSCGWLEWDQNLPPSLGSYRNIGVRHSHGATELSPLPSTQPLFPKLMRVRINQVILTSAHIPMKKKHSQ